MFEKIQFLEDYRCFTKGEEFAFLPGINFLVGDQGCGKSSLIGLLNQGDRTKIIRNICDGVTITMYMDFEHTPREKGKEIHSGKDIAGIIMGWMSHGESNLSLIKKMSEAKENYCFLLDEPDQALSIRSCYQILRGIKELTAQKNLQIIAAVHNPILIDGVETVLSLEHKKWMPSQEFIELHKGTNNA